jgi:D-arabinose 1-dehydrogenase-like Zn-dependent alcohol dehydrogenase
MRAQRWHSLQGTKADKVWIKGERAVGRLPQFAGVTTFNSLRNSGAWPGDLVAILGVGGLGHLGIQFAAKMGFKTIAIARGMDKEPLARKLGASSYIDSKTQDPTAELQHDPEEYCYIQNL